MVAWLRKAEGPRSTSVSNRLAMQSPKENLSSLSSDLDEQRKSVSAWREVAAAVTRPLRKRYSAQVLRLRWRKCFKVAAQIVAEILIIDETLEMGLSGLEAGFCSDGANAPFLSQCRALSQWIRI